MAIEHRSFLFSAISSAMQLHILQVSLPMLPLIENVNGVKLPFNLKYTLIILSFLLFLIQCEAMLKTFLLFLLGVQIKNPYIKNAIWCFAHANANVCANLLMSYLISSLVFAERPIIFLVVNV